MRILLRIFLVLVILFIVLLLSVSFYIATNGKTILLSQLEKNLGIKAKISDIKFIFPSTLVAEGVELSDTLKVKKVAIVPSFAGILRGDLGLNSLLLQEPKISVTRNSDNTFDYGLPPIQLPQPPVVSSEKPVPAKKTGIEEKKPVRFYINKLNIVNAEITFIDKGIIGQPPFVLKCYPFNLKVLRPSLIHFFRMQVDGGGDVLLADGQKAGELKVSGWFDPVNLDMNAELDVANGRLMHFAPYYKKYLKNELESGDANIVILAESKNNDMTADCHIEFTNIAFKKKEATQSTGEEAFKSFGDITEIAFGSLFGSEGKTTLDFSIRTKMNAPKFENVKFKGNFFKSTVEAVLSKPPKETIEDFKKIGDQFEAIGKQFKDIFKSK